MRDFFAEMKLDHAEFLRNAHAQLSQADGVFKNAFPMGSDFVNPYIDLQSTAETLWKGRTMMYDENAKKISDNLTSILKSLPEISMTDLAGFVKACTPKERTLLESCDSAADIQASIDADCQAFGCKPHDLCSALQEP